MALNQRTADRGRGTRAGHYGFTFVELLLAATIMSLLFVGLGSHLRGGIMVWQRATETVESLQQQRVALDTLETDLANAILYDPRETAALTHAFAADELQFITVRPTTPQRLGEVLFVTYRCESVDGGPPGLWRSSLPAGEALAGLQATSKLLVPACDALSVAYAYLPAAGEGPLEWHDAWDDPTRLPRLVAVTAAFASGRTLRRLILIPAGALKLWEPT